jgi:hypothetical protein
VNNWVHQLQEEVFIQVLPLLRRTFASFTTAERRKLGEKVKQGDSGTQTSHTEHAIAEERGAKGIPVIMQLLGYK